MYKSAAHHHAHGRDLQDHLLETEQEKAAVLSLITGPVGNYYGEKDAVKELKRRGYSPSQIEAAKGQTRGKGMAALSATGYQVGGGLVLGVPGAIAGAGLGGYRNYKIKRRAMIAKAREMRGMDGEVKKSRRRER